MGRRLPLTLLVHRGRSMRPERVTSSSPRAVRIFAMPVSLRCSAWRPASRTPTSRPKARSIARETISRRAPLRWTIAMPHEAGNPVAQLLDCISTDYETVRAGSAGLTRSGQRPPATCREVNRRCHCGRVRIVMLPMAVTKLAITHRRRSALYRAAPARKKPAPSSRTR